jgi:hypothetical protein
LFAGRDLDDRETDILGQIEEAKQKLRYRLQEPRRRVGWLRRQAFARAAQGSSSIEGYVAKLDDAAAIAAGDGVTGGSGAMPGRGFGGAESEARPRTFRM